MDMEGLGEGNEGWKELSFGPGAGKKHFQEGSGAEQGEATSQDRPWKSSGYLWSILGIQESLGAPQCYTQHIHGMGFGDFGMRFDFGMGWDGMGSSTSRDADPTASRASTASQKTQREARSSFDLPTPSRRCQELGIKSLAKLASGKTKKDWELIKIPGSSRLELLFSLSHLLVPRGFSWEPAQPLSPQLIPAPDIQTSKSKPGLAQLLPQAKPAGIFPNYSKGFQNLLLQP